MSYSLIGAPASASIDTNGVITWLPGAGQGHTTNLITTVATDTGAPALSATNSIVVMVSEINVAPVLATQSDRVLVGIQSLLVNNGASQTDSPPVTLSYQLAGAPLGAAIDGNGVITWTPTVAQVPSTNVFVTVVSNYNPWAVNSQRLSATNSFAVVVNLIHSAPVLPGQPNIAIPQYSTLTLTNTASTVNVPPLTMSYGLVDPPVGASITTNGVIVWTHWAPARVTPPTFSPRWSPTPACRN